jgi:hypothetical protein
MSGAVDVACVGPAFLDLTFEGLEELPGRRRSHLPSASRPRS